MESTSRKLSPNERWKIIDTGFESLGVFIPTGEGRACTEVLKQFITRNATIRNPKSFKGVITQVANQLHIKENLLVDYLNVLQTRLFRSLADNKLITIFNTCDSESINTYNFVLKLGQYMVHLYWDKQAEESRNNLPKDKKVLNCLEFIGIHEVSAIERTLVTELIAENYGQYCTLRYTTSEIADLLHVSQPQYLLKNFQKSVFNQLNRKQMKSIFNKRTKFRMNSEKFIYMLCKEVCKHMW